jgi:hypothetical protein
MLVPLVTMMIPRGADPHPPFLYKREGRYKSFGKQYSQTISNLGHAALLRRCELSR